MKLGLLGISIFVSSGDDGANGYANVDCTDNSSHAE